MTDTAGFLSEDEALAAVTRLDRLRLARFVRSEVIRPAHAGDGRMVYRQVDLARLELLCDLCDDFDLEDTALELVMELIDQLHGTRADLVALMRALAEEPEDVRLRVRGRLGR